MKWPSYNLCDVSLQYTYRNATYARGVTLSWSYLRKILKVLAEDVWNGEKIPCNWHMRNFLEKFNFGA